MGKEFVEWKDVKKEYEASKASMLEAIKKTTANKQVTFSGHSLGGAVAQIAALDAKTNNNDIQVKRIITFGAPRVFSPEAAKKYHQEELSAKTLRVKQRWDIIPKYPPKGLFAHAGNKVSLDAGTKVSIHSGSLYRKIANFRLTKDDLDKAREAQSSKIAIVPLKDYFQSVLKLSQDKFANLFNKPPKKTVIENVNNKTYIPPIPSVSSVKKTSQQNHSI